MTDPGSDPGTAMLRAFHARYAGGASAAFGTGDCGDGRSTYEHLLDHLPAADRVLDAGCGDGFLIERLLARAPDGKCVGVDMSPEELACATARLEGRAHWIEAALDAVPLPDGDVGAVMSHMVLMLITDIDPALGELARLLEPGGALVAVVGRRQEPPEDTKRLMEWLRATMDRLVGPPPPIGDRRWLDPDGLDALFDSPA